jgi:HlyD family secretion protein
MKKIYLYISIAVLVLGGVGYLMISNSTSKDPRYRTDKVSRGNILVQVRATGLINPVQTVDVGSQVSGLISKLYVDFNTKVKKGQVIAEIDPTFLKASVKEAEANLEHNQAQVNEAKRALTRATALFQKDLVSQADLDAATTTYESDLAQLKQTQAALDRARVNLLYATIRSPIDGVVISRDVDVGQTVAASLQTPKLFSIANDLTQMRVEASVDEADIGQIKEGQRVSFTVDAYPDQQFRGKVSQVRLAAVIVQNVTTYTVVIDVPNPDLKLRPGMTATVSILIDQRENALRIPVLALRFQPPADIADKFREQAPASAAPQDSGKDRTAQKADTGGGSRRGSGRRQGGQGGPGGGHQGGANRDQQSGPRKQRLWVIDADKNLKPVVVEVGLSDLRFAEITGGDLKEGDDIIIGMMAAETASSSNQQNNPFAPRGMGPGGGGGGRGR